MCLISQSIFKYGFTCVYTHGYVHRRTVLGNNVETTTYAHYDFYSCNNKLQRVNRISHFVYLAACARELSVLKWHGESGRTRTSRTAPSAIQRIVDVVSAVNQIRIKRGVRSNNKFVLIEQIVKWNASRKGAHWLYDRRWEWYDRSFARINCGSIIRKEEGLFQTFMH